MNRERRNEDWTEERKETDDKMLYNVF